MKRPLGIVTVLYAAGLLLGNYFPLPLLCLSIIVVALAVGAFMVRRLRTWLLRALLIFLGWTNFTWHTAITSSTDLRVLLTDEPALVSVRGVLAESPVEKIYPGDVGETIRSRARLKVAALRRETEWQPASGTIEVTAAGALPENFFKGQEVQIYGVLGTPSLPLAEGLFDYRTYLRRQEIYFELKTKSSNDWQIVSPGEISPPLNDRFIKWAKGALALGRPAPDDSVHLEYALTLSDKTYLTDELTEPFMQASTFHIFAVDGLRMAILFGIFFKTLRWLRVPRTACGLVLIPLFWFYVALTGWSASAIRAAVMLNIVLIGWMVKRPRDVLNSLFAAALIILLWQPQQIFQAGFQLSFSVVLCIFAVMPRFDKLLQRILQFDPLLPDDLRPRWQRFLHILLRYFLGLFLSSLAAWLGSIPLAAYYFHLFTPISAPANVVAVFLCVLTLICNVISLLLAGWFSSGALAFNYFGWVLMSWIHSSSIWFAKLPHAYAYVPAPHLFSIGLYYGILLAAITGWLFEARWRKWKWAVLVLLIFIWSGRFIYERSADQFTVLPLNGGSAIYCNAPGNKNDLVINCGDDDAVELVMKPYLRAQGVNSLPCVALTHGDARQIGGFEKFQALFPIEKVVTSDVHFRSPVYRDTTQLLESKPGWQQVVNAGDEFSRWTVLHPAANHQFPHADDNALVLCGEIQNTRILLLSDLGPLGEEELLEERAALDADIVVAGLPEENEPLKDALLDVIHPKLIVIADSNSPATRRASRALRERLQRRGVPVLFTSEVGAVKISLRKNRWRADTVEGFVCAGKR